MDSLQPLLLNDSNFDGDWKERGVTASTVYIRQKKLYEVTNQIIRDNIPEGNLPE